jgi:hypothetical protein
MPPKRKSSSVVRDKSPERKETKVEKYVVFRGEDYEGGSVEGIFSEKQAAQDLAHYLMNENPRPGRDWTADGEDCWHRGCDYIEVIPQLEFATFEAWKTWWESNLPHT